MTTARYWREIPQRFRLEAGKCKKCGKVFFPPRLICDSCKCREFDDINLSSEGEIVSYTVIHTPPSNFSDEAPYAIAIVNLGGEAKVLTQVVDCEFDELKVGVKVRVEFRRIQEDGKSGVLQYGYKCVLAD
jgi:uncharacterized protein